MPSLTSSSFASSKPAPAFKTFIPNILIQNHKHKLLIIFDIFFGWTATIAKELGIFHIVFSSYGLACYYSFWLNLPHRYVNFDEFSLSHFPEAHVIHCMQLPNNISKADGTNTWVKESEKGLVVYDWRVKERWLREKMLVATMAIRRTRFQGLGGEGSLENHSSCDTGINVAKKLLVFEVVSFSFFLFSSLAAQGLKLALNLLNSKDANEPFRAHINLRALRLDMVGFAIGSFMGCLFLILSMALN
ncbi:hypothetical protein JHK82_018377 [Glycine max]|nr:hypothetical protein JHK85_018808 [Glycine max]KAG5037564.1 hypothetical protein JHK86_018404 [Glycine max]KAG5142682.1 hypothetical protein JHK82_018377 [Glycine max]